jgi:hypothetical protein
MSWLDYNFKVITTGGRDVAFACLEYFDVASLQFPFADFYRAERDNHSISAGSRARRAWCAVPENSNEIIF